jgi:hypothetical protein
VTLGLSHPTHDNLVSDCQVSPTCPRLPAQVLGRNWSPWSMSVSPHTSSKSRQMTEACPQTAAWLAALDPASHHGRAMVLPRVLQLRTPLRGSLALPRVPQLRTPPPSSRGLRCYRVFYGTQQAVGYGNK